MSNEIVTPLEKHIEYTQGYKYQLKTQVTFLIPALRGYGQINALYYSLTSDGHLTVKIGYAWDGASGLAFDTKSAIRGSLVHDVLYQMMRQGELPQSFKHTADLILKSLCLADKMWKIRANAWYVAVDLFATSATLPSSRKQIIYAP